MAPAGNITPTGADVYWGFFIIEYPPEIVSQFLACTPSWRRVQTRFIIPCGIF